MSYTLKVGNKHVVIMSNSDVNNWGTLNSRGLKELDVVTFGEKIFGRSCQIYDCTQPLIGYVSAYSSGPITALYEVSK